MYCEEMSIQWDEALPLALFALRDSVQESTGFSPFELVYGHEVNGPFKDGERKVVRSRGASYRGEICI